MEQFITNPKQTRQVGGKTIYVFSGTDQNIDPETVLSFGDEWLKFNEFSDEDIQVAGDQYFDIVPKSIYKGKYALDVGCGTGRWSKFLSKEVHELEAIDPSEAVVSAASLLENNDNVRISQASAGDIPFPDSTFDLAMSLGVLHHIPDTQSAMLKCIEKVKPGGYFLVYLYYSLDNRGIVYRFLFSLSDLMRNIISSFPSPLKRFVCDILAFVFYLPFVGLTKLVTLLGFREWAKRIPLAYYVGKSINIIRNDARDRFGTPLEKRFSKEQIRQMMADCGLTDIIFSEKMPYWHALGKKK
jgi:ubiquinone/menaquinone biosynthesis C-methylase UbiE